jgi:hypothetical protein
VEFFNFNIKQEIQLSMLREETKLKLYRMVGNSQLITDIPMSPTPKNHHRQSLTVDGDMLL